MFTFWCRSVRDTVSDWTHQSLWEKSDVKIVRLYKSLTLTSWQRCKNEKKTIIMWKQRRNAGQHRKTQLPRKKKKRMWLWWYRQNQNEYTNKMAYTKLEMKTEIYKVQTGKNNNINSWEKNLNKTQRQQKNDRQQFRRIWM